MLVKVSVPTSCWPFQNVEEVLQDMLTLRERPISRFITVPVACRRFPASETSLPQLDIQINVHIGSRRNKTTPPRQHGMLGSSRPSGQADGSRPIFPSHSKLKSRLRQKPSTGHKYPC